MFSLLLRGFSTYRTYILIAALLSSLGGAGWVGWKLAVSHYQKDYISSLEGDIEWYEDTFNILSNYNSILAKREVKIVYVTKEVIKEVEVYVEANPALNECKLDDNGLSLWNGEIRSN